MVSYTYSPKVTVKAGGRGAGKTYAAVHWVLENALQDPNASIAMVGGKWDVVYFIEQLIAFGEPMGLTFEYFPARNRMKLSNGAEIFFYDPKNPDVLRGPTHRVLVGENTQSWPEDTYFNAKAACRPSDGKRALMFMTFLGTDSDRILELLRDGFDATTG